MYRNNSVMFAFTFFVFTIISMLMYNYLWFFGSLSLASLFMWVHCVRMYTRYRRLEDIQIAKAALDLIMKDIKDKKQYKKDTGYDDD